jgi:TonB family protein
MSETRPTRFFRRLLFLTAGLCCAALAAVFLSASQAAWHVNPIPEPPCVLPPADPVIQLEPGPAISVSEGMTRPVLLDTLKPRHTESARCARFQGTSILQATIDERGRVADTRILLPLPLGLERIAAEAVRALRFKPATLNGKPVKAYYNVVVDFDLPL